jgi:hypothetical protein
LTEGFISVDYDHVSKESLELNNCVVALCLALDSTLTGGGIISNLKLKSIVLAMAAGFVGAGTASSAYAQQKTAKEADIGTIEEMAYPS